jgi:hypothetical protein
MRLFLSIHLRRRDGFLPSNPGFRSRGNPGKAYAALQGWRIYPGWEDFLRSRKAGSMMTAADDGSRFGFRLARQTLLTRRPGGSTRRVILALALLALAALTAVFRHNGKSVAVAGTEQESGKTPQRLHSAGQYLVENIEFGTASETEFTSRVFEFDGGWLTTLGSRRFMEDVLINGFAVDGSGRPCFHDFDKIYRYE